MLLISWGSSCDGPMWGRVSEMVRGTLECPPPPPAQQKRLKVRVGSSWGTLRSFSSWSTARGREHQAFGPPSSQDLGGQRTRGKDSGF